MWVSPIPEGQSLEQMAQMKVDGSQTDTAQAFVVARFMVALCLDAASALHWCHVLRFFCKFFPVVWVDSDGLQVSLEMSLNHSSSWPARQTPSTLSSWFGSMWYTWLRHRRCLWFSIIGMLATPVNFRTSLCWGPYLEVQEMSKTAKVKAVELLLMPDEAVQDLLPYMSVNRKQAR